METLRDWVTYATQVSVVTVLSEREVPPPPDVLERGEGYIGREVTLAVEPPLWVAPDSRAIAPSEITVYGQGWWLAEGGKRRLFAFEGAQRFVPGEQFVLPLVLTEDGSWDVLSFVSALPYKEKRVAAARQGTLEYNNLEPTRLFDGKTVSNIAERLRSAAQPVAG